MGVGVGEGRGGGRVYVQSRGRVYVQRGVGYMSRGYRSSGKV